jgi:DNA repair ATPase RecN
MASKNQLVPQSALDITPEEEQELKFELIEQIDQTSLSELRKIAIAQKSEAIKLDTKENNLQTVEEINKRITNVVQGLLGSDVTERVFESIETAKDYNEAVKAVNGLVDLRNKQLDKTIDEFANTGKKKRIAVQFQSQGVSVAVGIQTDE